MSDEVPAKSRLRQIRLVLWSLIALVLVGTAATYVIVYARSKDPDMTSGPVKTRLGGPFTLVASNGKPFSSGALTGKPYAIYFGFTRCGDTCPTTLQRLVKLRREAENDQALSVVFVTIDPTHDGPREVGQYASLFNAPIIGLTGSEKQIDQVKKAYGIYAAPVANVPMGKEMEHSAIVLLFDRTGTFAGTIAPNDGDGEATAKLRKLIA